MIDRAKYDEAREALGLTHREVAELVGVHRVSVHRWMSGAARPTLDHLVALGEALGIDWKKLVG